MSSNENKNKKPENAGKQEHAGKPEKAEKPLKKVLSPEKLALLKKKAAEKKEILSKILDDQAGIKALKFILDSNPELESTLMPQIQIFVDRITDAKAKLAGNRPHMAVRILRGVIEKIQKSAEKNEAAQSEAAAAIAKDDALFQFCREVAIAGKQQRKFNLSSTSLDYVYPCYTINFRAKQGNSPKILSNYCQYKAYEKEMNAAGVESSSRVLQNNTKRCPILQKCSILRQ
jgi:hypothetical protein